MFLFFCTMWSEVDNFRFLIIILIFGNSFSCLFFQVHHRWHLRVKAAPRYRCMWSTTRTERSEWNLARALSALSRQPSPTATSQSQRVHSKWLQLMSAKLWSRNCRRVSNPFIDGVSVDRLFQLSSMHNSHANWN